MFGRNREEKKQQELREQYMNKSYVRQMASVAYELLKEDIVSKKNSNSLYLIGACVAITAQDQSCKISIIGKSREFDVDGTYEQYGRAMAEAVAIIAARKAESEMGISNVGVYTRHMPYLRAQTVIVYGVTDVDGNRIR